MQRARGGGRGVAAGVMERRRKEGDEKFTGRGGKGGGARGLWEKREGRGRRPKGNRKGKERSKSVIGMGRHK